MKKIIIGDLTISEPNESGHVWIQKKCGEGSEFDADKVEKAIREFFDEEF
jgi:hypothetical protein